MVTLQSKLSPVSTSFQVWGIQLNLFPTSQWCAHGLIPPGQSGIPIYSILFSTSLSRGKIPSKQTHGITGRLEKTCQIVESDFWLTKQCWEITFTSHWWLKFYNAKVHGSASPDRGSWERQGKGQGYQQVMGFYPLTWVFSSINQWEGMSGREMVEKKHYYEEMGIVPDSSPELSCGAGIYCILKVSWVPPANSGTKTDDSCSISQIRSIRKG